MRFRTFDGNSDWRFGRGQNDYATDSNAIAYDLKSKILSWYGDCFFAMEEGLDWKNILGSKNGKEALDKGIKQIIALEEGVIELTYFDSSLVGRDYHCTARVKTEYNETIEVKI